MLSRAASGAAPAAGVLRATGRFAGGTGRPPLVPLAAGAAGTGRDTGGGGGGAACTEISSTYADGTHPCTAVSCGELPVGRASHHPVRLASASPQHHLPRRTVGFLAHYNYRLALLDAHLALGLARKVPDGPAHWVLPSRRRGWRRRGWRPHRWVVLRRPIGRLRSGPVPRRPGLRGARGELGLSRAARAQELAAGDRPPGNRPRSRRWLGDRVGGHAFVRVDRAALVHDLARRVLRQLRIFDGLDDERLVRLLVVLNPKPGQTSAGIRATYVLPIRSSMVPRTAFSRCVKNSVFSVQVSSGSGSCGAPTTIANQSSLRFELPTRWIAPRAIARSI